MDLLLDFAIYMSNMVIKLYFFNEIYSTKYYKVMYGSFISKYILHHNGLAQMHPIFISGAVEL